MTTYPATFELPTTDPLTGLLSATYFRHLLREKLLPDAQASSDPLSIVLFDCDNFLPINLTYGPACGDRVLTALAATVRETMPEGALSSRYGGDEFAVALPDTRVDDAFTLAEELRRRVAALRFPEWPEVAFTCSVGLAAYPANGGGDVELMREAEGALYLAKVGGRNKVALPLAVSLTVFASCASRSSWVAV